MQESRPVGRPSSVTPDVLNKLEQAFAMGCSDLEACFYADISDKTLYNYQNENPEFLQRKRALKEKPVLMARASVVDALKANPELALKFLERKRKSEFGLRTELTGPDGESLVPKTVIVRKWGQANEIDSKNNDAILIEKNEQENQ